MLDIFSKKYFVENSRLKPIITHTPQGLSTCKNFIRPRQKSVPCSAGLLLVIQGLFILRQQIRHARYRFLGARRFVPMRFFSHMEFASIYMFQTIRIIFQAGNSLNAVEHKPVSTRVFNPYASKVSYKPKQLKNRKTKLKLFSLLWYESSICLGANFPRHETSRIPDFYLGRIQFQHEFVLYLVGTIIDNSRSYQHDRNK